ncbi:NRDE family protein [soil metagenome]
MCLLVFALRAHPRYRFVFAGNRDELHTRATEAAGWWPDADSVLGGRDLEAGGTWLAVTRGGRFGVVANVRESAGNGHQKRSRGELVADYVRGRESPAEFGAVLQSTGLQYAGFSLVLGDQAELYYFSNRDRNRSSLPPGVHGIDNERLNAPGPRLARARQGFEALLVAEDLHADSLFDLLADRTPAREREASSFLVGPAFGTRSSSVILIDRAGELGFFERRFGPQGELLGSSAFAFPIGGAG